jgi:PAS domain S-box-containing protein
MIDENTIKARGIDVNSFPDYYSAFQHASLGFALFDNKGYFLSVNESYEQMFGYSVNELISKHFLEITHPDDRQGNNVLFKALIDGEIKSVCQKKRYLHKNGQIRWATVTISPVKAKNGVITQFLSVVENIGEAKEMLSIFKNRVHYPVKQTKENHYSNRWNGANEFERLFDVLPDIFCVCKQDGSFKKLSVAASKITGYPLNELTGKSLLEIIHPDDRCRAETVIKQLEEGYNTKYLEIRCITKDNVTKWLSWTFEILQEDHLIYAVGRDITEKKLMEKMIESEQNRFSKMFEEAPVSMSILKGKDHVFTAANNEYYKLTGRKEDIIGKTVREVFPEISDQQYFEWLDKVFDTGETFSSDECLLRIQVNKDSDRSDKYIDFMYQPFTNEAGQIEGIFYFGVDITEKVIARKKIEESEERFRVIFEQASVGVAVVETHTGKHLKVNEKYSQIFGYKESEFKALSLAELTHYDGLEDDVLDIEMALKNNDPTDVTTEKKCLRKNGEVIWVSMSVSSMWKGDHTHLQYMVIIQDITEKKKAAEILIDSEKRYVDLIANLPAAIYTTDKEGNILLYNKAAEKLWGKKPLTGKDYWCGSLAIFDNEGNEIKHADCLMAQSVRTGMPIRGRDIIIKRPQGDIRHVIPYPSVICNSKKVITGGVNVLIDVTELKEAEAELEKLSLIAKKTVNPVIISNLEREIEWVNDAFATVTGYQAAEAIGKKMDELLHGDLTSDLIISYINKQVKLKKPFECEMVKYNKLGGIYWVAVKGQPMLNKLGEVTHYFEIETDITERKIAFRKLEEKESKIRKFASQLNLILEEDRTRIAREIHDEFGQQLSGLKMSLSALSQSGNFKENKIINEVLEGVEYSMQSLRKISTELRPSILDTMGLMPSLEWLMSEFEKKSGIPCICDIQPTTKIFDKNTAICIFRICQEALTNISKHANASAVKLNIAEFGNELSLTIHDNGIGFDEKNINKPFSMGILGMQERANLINADFTIIGKKGTGTSIVLKLEMYEHN